MKYTIKAFLFFTLLGWSVFHVSAQEPEDLADSLIVKKQLSVKTAITGLSLFSAGTYIALSQIWYADFPKSKFHFFDDSREWLGMDKLGHIYATQHLSELGYNVFAKTSLTDQQAALAGTVFGWSFQFGFECLDGNNDQWGFSFSDLAANTVGAGLFLTQARLWNRQYLRIKYSYSPSQYAAYRPAVLGSNHAERFLKDYNGQTYWLSGSPFALIKSMKKLDWLCLSFGYSVNEKLHGNFNHFTINQRTFQAHSTYVLSLDIDVDAMNIQQRWLKQLLSPLRWIKIPFPALVMSTKGVELKPLYF